MLACLLYISVCLCLVVLFACLPCLSARLAPGVVLCCGVGMPSSHARCVMSWQKRMSQILANLKTNHRYDAPTTELTEITEEKKDAHTCN